MDAAPTVGFQQLAQLAGGIVLFLYGLRLSSDNLKAVAGSRLKVIIKLLTGNRFLGLVAGIAGTVLVQSNTATAVILVGLCQAGVITLDRSIGVLLGANLGSTLTVQFIAFDLYAYALLVIAVGFLGTLKLDTRRTRIIAVVLGIAGLLAVLEGVPAVGWILVVGGTAFGALSYVVERKAAGLALMGFGLIFVGMKIIGAAMAILRENPAFVDLLVRFQEWPVLVILASFVFTVLTNSSTATLGTAIALVAAGGSATGALPLLTPIGAVAVVMGAHLGSCPMAVLSSTGAGRIARQVSYAHVVVKILGVLVVYPLLEHFAAFLTWFNTLVEASAARGVANAHTLFNLVNVVTILPFTPQVARLLDALCPAEKAAAPGILQHISEEQMEFHPMAMDSVELEVKRLAFMVRGLVRQMEEALTADSTADLWRLKEADDQVDELFGSILAFMKKLGQERLGQELFQRIMTMVYILTHLEGIGDCVSKDFFNIMRKRVDRDVQFSIEGINLLTDIHHMLLERMDAVIKILGKRDFAALARILDGQEEFYGRTRVLTKAHFKQLVKGVHAAEDTTMIYLDTIATMKNIHRALVDIAQNIRYCPYYSGLPTQDGQGTSSTASGPASAGSAGPGSAQIPAGDTGTTASAAPPAEEKTT